MKSTHCFLTFVSSILLASVDKAFSSTTVGSKEVIAWCKPDYCLASVNIVAKGSKKLFYICMNIESDDVHDEVWDGEDAPNGWVVAPNCSHYGISGEEILIRNEEKSDVIGPDWVHESMEIPAGTRDMNGWTKHVYTEEQQKRLNVDEVGNLITAVGHMTHMSGVIGPDWVHESIEKPSGTRDMNGWTKHVYTEEQQKELNVDEDGNFITAADVKKTTTTTTSSSRNCCKENTVQCFACIENVTEQEYCSMYSKTPGCEDVMKEEYAFVIGMTGPAWTRDEMEKPEGTHDTGRGWIERVYTEEQQARLGVNEEGLKINGVAPAPTPVFSQDEKTVSTSDDVICCDAMIATCLACKEGVTDDEYCGQNPTVDGCVQILAKQYAFLPGTIGPDHTYRSEMEKPEGVRDMGGWDELYYTKEQQERLGVTESGAKIDARQRLVGPDWTHSEIEKPEGVRNMGDFEILVYTEEQQMRLGINEYGTLVAEKSNLRGN